MESMSEQVPAMGKRQRGSEVGKTPLQDLMLFDPLPRIAGRTRYSLLLAERLSVSGVGKRLGHWSFVARI
jgi:hypothetical protein